MPSGTPASSSSRPVFALGETHGVLQRSGARVGASSEGLGWTSAYASNQRERPFEGRFHALSDCLMVLHRGGPVDVAFNLGGRSVSRHIPKDGIFFLPAGHVCDVHLQGPLDSTHIYLRAHLFESENAPATRIEGLAPLFGERDAVIAHLAGAVGEIVAEAASSLAVDPLAQALASRFIDINFRRSVVEPARRSYQLSEQQLRRVRAFIEAHLETDIRLEAMAAACGISPDYFLRMFKTTVGVSPYQFVINQRVERAKQLLSDDGVSLAEIALRCGFSHQEHLTRMFRRFTGVTPGRYRRGS
jgi:AraC family transcriptional regulator